MPYLLRRVGSQNTWFCKAVREISLLLLFCYPKLYEGGYCVQKEIAFACRDALHVYMSQVGDTILSKKWKLPMPRLAMMTGSKKCPLMKDTEVDQQINWVWKEAQFMARPLGKT